MIQRLSRTAYAADTSAASAEMVEKVIDERRRHRETGLNRGHISVLEAIIADPEHRLPDDDLAEKLLTTGALLPYPDGSEWYYPHPLLTMKFLRMPGWVEQVGLSLRLGKAGILIHVDSAAPERLGDLVRGLVATSPDLDVHDDLGALDAAPEGSVLVLLPRAEHADALNLGRPIFARRKLKVVLFCDRETSAVLAREAPDFFDWISEHHECPPGPVAHAVAGLRAAPQAGTPAGTWNGYPGILWSGPGDVADTQRMLIALSAAFPGEEQPMWVNPQRDYEDLIHDIKRAKASWLACKALARSHVRRLRWAMADAERRGRTILVTETHPCPGWWPVHGRLMPFAEARRVLAEAGAPRPGALAALVGLEPEAVELSKTLLSKGVTQEDLVQRIGGAADLGAALAKRAWEEGLVRLDDVASGEAPPPVLRALAGEGEVEALRIKRLEAIDRSFARGERIAATQMGWWSASTEAKRSVTVVLDAEAIEYAVEARLRARPQTGEAWIGLAQLALQAGEVDAAGVWTAEGEGYSSTRDLDAMTERLAELKDRRADAIRASKERSERRLFAAFALAAAGCLVGWLLGRTGGIGNALALFVPVAIVLWIILRLLALLIALLARIRAWRARASVVSLIELRIDDARERARKGDYAGAVRALEEVIAAERGKLTEEHPSIRRALALHARTLVEHGENERAEVVTHEILALEARIEGVAHPSFTSIVPILAMVLVRTGRPREAEALLRKLLGPDAPKPTPDEAEGSAPTESYLQLFLASPAASPLTPEQRFEALRLLADAWITQGRYEEAVELLAPVAKQVDTTLAPDHPERRLLLAAYGRALALQRRPELAESILRGALALAETYAGEHHPDTVRILVELARVEHQLARPEAAATAARALALYATAQVSGAERTVVRSELAPIVGPPAA